MDIYKQIFIITIISLVLLYLLLHLKKKEDFVPYNYGINRFKKIYYINLKDREDRDKLINKELKKVGVNFENVERIDAVKHEIGGIGCAKSHIKTLKKGFKENQPYIIILEDDFIWNHDSKIVNDKLEKIYNELEKNQYDVCLLSCMGDVKNINDDISNVVKCQLTSGYIIRRDYINILKNFWIQKLEEANRLGVFNRTDTTPSYHIDQTWKELQKKDNWIITEPVLGYQQPSFSDIGNKIVDYYTPDKVNYIN